MPYLIDDKNYAQDDNLALRARDFVSSIANECFSRRAGLNEAYNRYYNIFKCVFDVRYYNGSSEVYIPELRNKVEFYVSRLKKALFPTDDVFEVEPVDPSSAGDSAVIQAHMKWQIDKKIKVKAKISRFLRQLVMYGWAPVKCVWDYDTRKTYGQEIVEEIVKKYVRDPITNKKYLTPIGNRKTLVEVEKDIVIKNNPTFDPIDIFHFYVYPYSANSIEEAYGTVEIFRKSLVELRREEEKGLYLNTDRVTGDHGTSPFSWPDSARFSTQDLDNQDMKQIPYMTGVEYWGWFDWSKDEDGSDVRQSVITIDEGGEVLQLRKNPFYDQENPNLMARFTELENEVYPDGLIAPNAALSYFLNDIYAQTFDTIAYTLNPIVKYDPGAVVNMQSIAFAPGAMWAVSNPNDVVLDRPPDVSQAGFAAAAQIKEIIGETPGTQNIPMTGRKAATHISAIQQEYSLPIIDLAENIEYQVMSPWLFKVYKRNQQFLNEIEIFMVAGKNGVKNWKKMSPEMLVGDYAFFWRGSNEATNLHVKSRQMTEFLNAVAPFALIMEQQGARLDFPYIFKRIWREALGLDGEDRLIQQIETDVSIDPETENLLLSLGKYIPTSMNDNHEQHLQTHESLLNSGNEYAVSTAMRHYQEHQLKFQQMQQSMQQQGSSGQPQTEESESLPGEQDLEGQQPVNPRV